MAYERKQNRDLTIRYKRSFFGFLWTMLHPLLLMMIFTIIFSGLFRFHTPHYETYFLSAYVAWNFFYGLVNFDAVFGTRNLYGRVELFAGRYNEAIHGAGLSYVEAFDSDLAMARFKEILADWVNAGFDPFAAPAETARDPFGEKDGDNLAARIVKGGHQSRPLLALPLVADSRANRDACRLHAHGWCRDIRAPLIDVRRVCRDEPNVAINPGARVPARVRLLRVVHPDRHHIAGAEADVGSELVPERAVAVGPLPEGAAVDPDLAVAVHAIELDEYDPAGVAGGH